MKRVVQLLRRVFWMGLNPEIRAPLKAVPSPAPHEQYPEILHWQAGDEIRNDTHAASRGFWFRFVSVTSEGIVYGDNVLDNHRSRLPLWRIMRDGTNLSLRDREINDELTQSNEYMRLIEAFNVSFAELQERDKKLRLVS